MRASIVLVSLLVLGPPPIAAPDSASPRALTVAESIETTKLLGQLHLKNPVLLSPDGERYLVLLIRGDIQRNGNWVEFLTGRTDSVNAALNFKIAARLFTTSGHPNDLRYVPNNFAWLADNERVVFLWDDGSTPTRVMTLNLRTGQLQTLVRHETDITAFSVSDMGDVVIYTAVSAEAELASARMLESGFAVSATDLHPFLMGNLTGHSRWNHGDVFVWSSAHPEARNVRRGGSMTYFPPQPRLSPDGHWAVMELAPHSIPENWDRYTDSDFRSFLARARTHEDTPGYIAQLWVIDTANAQARPLWNVPAELFKRTWVWSADGRSIVLGPTALPLDSASASGLAATSVVEIELATGRFSELPMPADHGGRVPFRPVSWNEEGILEIASAESDRSWLLRKTASGWRVSDEGVPALEKRRPTSVRIEWRQDYQASPVLVAVATQTGQEHRILEINPGLDREFTLGKVERVSWADKKGRTWSGHLYYPVHYSSDRKYPLVIQSHPIPAHDRQFSLNGHEGINTAFAAQPLANRGIAVLQMSTPDGGLGSDIATIREREIILAGYVGAIEHFAGTGLAAREKIGLVGFSRSGQYVTYALMQPELAVAAAIVADNHDASYLQYLMGNAEVRFEYEQSNGAKPFADGLRTWLERAPGFNPAKVHTPLRMEREAGGIASIIGSWEIFSNLRYLNKPVELYMVPEIQEAAHSLEKPAQVLASLSGTVDWMDFWLNGREDPDPTKAEQYARWRKLRELHEADLRAAQSPE